jgi:hypothetical protein
MMACCSSCWRSGSCLASDDSARSEAYVTCEAGQASRRVIASGVARLEHQHAALLPRFPAAPSAPDLRRCAGAQQGLQLAGRP